MAPSSPAVYVLAGAVLPNWAARAVTAAAAAALLLWAAAGWRSPPAAKGRIQSDLAEVRRTELRGTARSIVAGVLVVPPAWETSAIMLLIPLAVVLGASRGRAAWIFIGVVVLSLVLAPASLIWPWKNGALVALAHVGLLCATRAGCLLTGPRSHTPSPKVPPS
jgi:hypothetical protein